MEIDTIMNIHDGPQRDFVTYDILYNANSKSKYDIQFYGNVIWSVSILGFFCVDINLADNLCPTIIVLSAAWTFYLKKIY